LRRRRLLRRTVRVLCVCCCRDRYEQKNTPHRFAHIVPLVSALRRRFSKRTATSLCGADAGRRDFRGKSRERRTAWDAIAAASDKAVACRTTSDKFVEPAKVENAVRATVVSEEIEVPTEMSESGSEAAAVDAVLSNFVADDAFGRMQ
jgi:hypothetical protein